MATSNSTNFNVTRNELIAGALQVLGVADPASFISPTSEQFLQAASALNIMVKAWQSDGLQLWALKEHNFPLTSSATYSSTTLGIAKPLKVIGAYRRNTVSNIDVPLTIITRDEYNNLPNKNTQAGIPINLYYDPQLDVGTVYVWPAPSNAAINSERITIRYQRPFEDFDAATDTPDFPQEWLAALKWGLARELSFNYGLTEQRISVISSMAKEYRQQALSSSREEGSIFFTKAQY